MNELTDKKIEAQLIKYFHKVISHTALNYYKKRFKQKEKEKLADSFLQIVSDIESFEEDTLTNMRVKEAPLAIFNEEFEAVLVILSSKEKLFLIEKFIFDKTDKDIGQMLGVSRQAVSNMKRRLYVKIKNQMINNGAKLSDKE